MDAAKISEALYNWYQENARDLPWRKTKDAYKIWVSEIILQQTRVEQGIPYYHKFLYQFPTVADLAKASEEDVLLVWQGLGYYSRARNMYQAAQSVMVDFKGIFPSEYVDLIKLKGIGKYTASAISSMVISEKRAVVDGNVIRLISRIWNITDSVDKQSTLVDIEKQALAMIQAHDSGIMNQAMMEFGAIYCVPQNPNCSECIFNKKCIAYIAKNQQNVPLKQRKKEVQKRYFNYLFVQNNKNQFVIYQRQESDIWQGLFELPLIEKEAITLSEIEKIFGTKGKVFKSFTMKKHLLSHQQIWATVFLAKASATSQISVCKNFNGKIIAMHELENFPISKLTKEIIMLISELVKEQKEFLVSLKKNTTNYGRIK